MITIDRQDQLPSREILAREEEQRKAELSAAVGEIIAAVRARGDQALRDYAKTFDHVEVEALEVTAQELDKAVEDLDPAFRQVLEEAAENIRDFHSRQVRQSFVVSQK